MDTTRYSQEERRALLPWVDARIPLPAAPAVRGRTLAAVGAAHGEGALPARWREGLLGRTREEDDGHVQDLIDQAIEAFVA